MEHRISLRLLAVVLTLGVTGCSSLRGQKEPPAVQVSLLQVPEPARTTIVRLTSGTVIKKIEQAQEGGRTVYDVEGTRGDREVEYDVAADGTVLSSGRTVPFASLPVTVRAAAGNYFGLSPVLKAFVEVEGGKTFYEVEGKKGGTLVTLKLTDTGQIVEEEKK